MKCQVDENSSWWSVKLNKCHVDEMSSWWNVKLMNWQFDKWLIWQNGKLMICQVDDILLGKMSNWQNGKLTKCLGTKYGCLEERLEHKVCIFKLKIPRTNLTLPSSRISKLSSLHHHKRSNLLRIFIYVAFRQASRCLTVTKLSIIDFIVTLSIDFIVTLSIDNIATLRIYE